jgi:aminomuconate-semialdehyde/2-hydroxymuconate-6-semialdehyde dehydrogenase
MLDVSDASARPSEASSVPLVRHFIAGAFVGDARTAFDKASPVTGALAARVCKGSAADVDAAVDAAHAALNGPWGQLTLAQRTDLIATLIDGINRRFDDFLAAEIADTGKPASLARHLDIPRGAANFKSLPT